MEYASSHNRAIVIHTLSQMADACDMITTWNRDVAASDAYLISPDGMQKMAASCMLIESIGEGVKKIDRLMPDFLISNAPDIPWKSIKGLRDHIAHGYFNLDSEIIFDIAINEIPVLHSTFIRLQALLYDSSDMTD